MFDNSQNQIFQYNGSPITFQKGDSVMVNATEMAKPFGKLAKDWLSNKSTKEFLSTLSSVRTIPLTALVEIKQGGNKEQGTWMHEDVALEFARWLSPAFAIWCNDRIKELLTTGSASLQPQLPNFNNPAEAARAWADQYEKNQTLALEVQQQQATIELQEKEIKQAAPKVNYYDTHLQSVNTLTTTQVAKEIGMNAEKLNSKLKELGIQYKQSDQWLLKAPYDRWGMHDVRTNIFTSERGNTHTNTYTVWTQRGRRFIIALYENDWDVKKAIKQIKGEMNSAA
ncbi:phage antirepressor KilAC domain-containing protein [Bacteroides faecis]|uniref:phage antirepressor KilAC domain-containing protein n=1 Tax=Bacteroides faecis TaxID=674529 RepID=UPI001C8B510C|nr:phage antirepressor KilAC domain-containing protein [Bacteroides faecis]